MGSGAQVRQRDLSTCTSRRRWAETVRQHMADDYNRDLLAEYPEGERAYDGFCRRSIVRSRAVSNNRTQVGGY